DPGDRRRAQIHERLVAAGTHHRLGAHLHAQPAGPDQRDRRKEVPRAHIRGRRPHPVNPRSRRALRPGRWLGTAGV
ncbi:MAG: Oxidoreductase, partial [uncultured Chloroflexia bacterium]